MVMASAMISAKAAILFSFSKESVAPAWMLLAVSFEDVLIAIVMGLICAGLFRSLKNRPLLSKTVWMGVLVLGALVIGFSVAEVALFKSLGQPLNARVMAMAGRISNLQSSLLAHADPKVAVCLVAAMAVFVLTMTWRRLALPASRTLRITLIAAGVIWIAGGFILRGRIERGNWLLRAAKNPQRELVCTLFSKYFLSASRFPDTFPASYGDDFKLAADRRPGQLPGAQTAPKNVILLILESTSTEYLSLYGSAYDTTPRLIAESKNAMVFDYAYTHVGYTFCAMIPMFYSVYPGLPWWYVPTDVQSMPRGLAGILQERGYRTAYFSSSDPGWQGMGYMIEKAGVKQVFGPDEIGGPRASSWGVEDASTFNSLIDWIKADPQKPFFAAIWTDQTHDPYTLEHEATPIDFRVDQKAADPKLFNTYLNAVRRTDHHVGRLLEMLRQTELADDTLVVIIGDHGEAFGERHTGNIGHGGGAYNENLRIPMIFWNPRLFPTGTRNPMPAGLVDLNPTLAGILNIPVEPDWQGASLFSPDHPKRVYFFADRMGNRYGFYDGQYKYINHVDDDFEELFDLGADPLEQTNIVDLHHELLDEYRLRTAAFFHSEEKYLKNR